MNINVVMLPKEIFYVEQIQSPLQQFPKVCLIAARVAFLVVLH